MPARPDARAALVDYYAHLDADLVEGQQSRALERLRTLAASALRRQLGLAAADVPVSERWWTRVTPELARQRVLERLPAQGLAGDVTPALIVRRDAHARAFGGGFADATSAMRPAEHVGPLVTEAGLDVWFDVFVAPPTRIDVRQPGVPAPAFIASAGRIGAPGVASLRVDLDAGTIWIRADLLGPGFPAGGYVGVKIAGGRLQLRQPATVSGGDVLLPDAPNAKLTVRLAPDAASPTAGGCDTASTSVSLPASLTFDFKAGALVCSGDAGAATAWGQTFQFSSVSGAWTFVARAWTAVLGYTSTPATFDADPIADELVTFGGTGGVVEGGLGLPVVAPPSPAALGDVTSAASWWLRVDRLTARWYDDPRPHELDRPWIGISAASAHVVADAVVPQAPAVAHEYALWSLTNSDHRLPWRMRYPEPTWLVYRCHVAEGEDLLVQGRAEVALDRPLTTDGIPLICRTTTGIVGLHRHASDVTASLITLVDDDRAMRQFALQNALVWTGAPAFVLARGPLSGAQVDAGAAYVLFGVHRWAPILPDPYVANARLQRPTPGRTAPQSLLWARIDWSAPTAIVTSFSGQLGSGVAMTVRHASEGELRGAGADRPKGQHLPLQVDQERRTFDERGAAEWRRAQAIEAEARGPRQGEALEQDRRSAQLVERAIVEAIGPAPNLRLLDVSTNQDLLGVALAGRTDREAAPPTASSGNGFAVSGLSVEAPMSGLRVIALPQVQWEPVRTLDSDQDILTMGWFPTPLASATDGGATEIGARSQKMARVVPEDALQRTIDVFRDGTPVGIRTTLPFGLVAGIRLQPADTPQRKADLYGLTRPTFAPEHARGGIQITAKAEGGRPDEGGISPMFAGQTRQLLNGVDLATGAPLGLSVLGSTADPAGSVETVFNADMAARPRVPVTRLDISGYGGSNFSDWNNPFAAFAEAAKVQFRVMVGRTALEVIKVNSVLHPWGIRVTRSVTVERRPGGGVIRRDSGWQAFTPGIFDYRYFDKAVNGIVVAPYQFDAGLFRGLFDVRAIRLAPGQPFTHGDATLVPYYFDAEVAIDGTAGLTPALGVLGYLQTTPPGTPAGADALKALIEAQGPVGGPVDAWLDFGGSGLRVRAQRVEVGLANNGGTPVFVATVRGLPKLPTTGTWSVVTRPAAGVPPGGGEATPVPDSRGVPLIRRYPVQFVAGDTAVYREPRLAGATGDYRMADAADLLTPAAPSVDYGILQSTPTHAFLFPRPFVTSPPSMSIQTAHRPALADLLARSTSKGAFPPPVNSIELAPGGLHFDVAADGSLALSAPVTIVGHPTPLRMAGTPGHGTSAFYDDATLRLSIDHARWDADFTGVKVWSDIMGLDGTTGAELRVVGGTEQRPQIAELRSLMLSEIEDVLSFIPIFGDRGVQGPIDLGATNAKHEFKLEVMTKGTIPPPTVIAAFPAGSGVVLTLFVKQSTGFDLAKGGVKASATFGANLEGRIPVLSVGVATVFVVVAGEITFSIASLSGAVTSESLDLMAFAGVGVEGKIGPFKAYAFLGVGFVLTYDVVADITKYGGIVALEAAVDVVIVKIKIRAELKGLVYKDAGSTKCDYSGNVKVQVDLFLIISISATYKVTETATL